MNRTQRMAVIQIGARRHYAVPWILNRSGKLSGLYTDAYATQRLRQALERLPLRCRPNVLRAWLDRTAPGIPESRIHAHALWGLRRTLRRRSRRGRAALTCDYLRANREFGRLLVRRGFGNADSVYAFNGAALEVFRHARGHGLTTVLDQTSAPIEVEERLQREELARWPGWELREPNVAAADCAAREREEWNLADLIVCGSPFVTEWVRRLTGGGIPCVTVPYGIRNPGPAAVRRAHSGPLRVLYAGHVRLLKGVQYLAEAVRLLDPGTVEVRAVGRIQLLPAGQRELRVRMELLGPVPRSEIGRAYAWADTLVVPSLSEGSPNVSYEAMAAGLPVVATEHAGTVIEDGVDGFVVPVRDAQALAARLALLAGDRRRLADLSAAALRRSADFNWERYAARLAGALEGNVS